MIALLVGLTMQTNVSAITGFQQNRAGSVRYIGAISDRR
jgi:hypothetical protein